MINNINNFLVLLIGLIFRATCVRSFTRAHRGFSFKVELPVGQNVTLLIDPFTTSIERSVDRFCREHDCELQKKLLHGEIDDYIKRILFERISAAYREHMKGNYDTLSWTAIASASIQHKHYNRSKEAEYFSRGILNPVILCKISERREKIFSENCATDYYASSLRQGEATLLHFIKMAENMFNHRLYSLVQSISYYSLSVLWLERNEPRRTEINFTEDHDLYLSLLLLTESHRANGDLNLSTLFSEVLLAYMTPKGSLNLLFRLRTLLSLPPVPPNYEEASLQRQEIIEDLKLLIEDIDALKIQISLKDLLEEVTSTPFYMAHQGLNDREFMEVLFSVMQAACPDLRYTAPQVANKKSIQSNKLKLSVGFISNYFYDQSIGRILLNVINFLNQDPSLILYVFFVDRELNRGSVREDEVSRVYSNILNDRFVRISPLTNIAREEIAKYELDFIIFTDIGMDFSTYALAFSRLATYQIAWWGHPITTGIPSIDFYFGLDVEIYDADKHYSEQLVRMVCLYLILKITIDKYDAQCFVYICLINFRI